jgi:hypothetical protein
VAGPAGRDTRCERLTARVGAFHHARMTLAPRIRNVVLVASLMGGFGVYVACTDAAINDVHGCTAGTTKECGCADGHASTQTCFADGSYSACACGQVLEAGPLPDAGASEAAAETAVEASPETLPADTKGLDDAREDTKVDAAGPEADRAETPDAASAG